MKLLSISFLVLFSAHVMSQKKQPNKSVVVVYKTNPKAVVDCEVIKIARISDKEVRLGKVEGRIFKFPIGCVQGERFKFHPISSNYVDAVKDCGFREDTIFILSRARYASLWGNAMMITKSDNFPKEYYAIAAISSKELIAYSDYRKDSLIALNNQALKKYFNGDYFPSEENRIERTENLAKAFYKKQGFNTSNSLADSVVKYSNIEKMDQFVLGWYYFEIKGEPKKALGPLVRASKENSEAYWVIYELAKVNLRLDNNNEAERLAKKAIDQARKANDKQFEEEIKKFFPYIDSNK